MELLRVIEEDRMTHGESVGQESNIEKGMTTRLIQRLMLDKTGGYASGISSISG